MGKAGPVPMALHRGQNIGRVKCTTQVGGWPGLNSRLVYRLRFVSCKWWVAHLRLTGMAKAECERLQIEIEKYRFTRRTVLEYSKWGDAQLRQHLKQRWNTY